MLKYVCNEYKLSAQTYFRCIVYLDKYEKRVTFKEGDSDECLLSIFCALQLSAKFYENNTKLYVEIPPED